jgi:formylglycine-generating enzyme
MKQNKPMTAAVAFGLVLGMMTAGTAQADTFGSGTNMFTIDFVDVGNAGNADDAGAGGGLYSSPYGGVAYDYRISTYEISQNNIFKAMAEGLANVTAGAHTGDEPAANISWYEAAAFVNWLNTSQGYQAAYNLSFSSSWSMTLWGASEQATTGVDSGTNPYRHKDAYYFLPSEDEWYKAAYHQNDGVTANYWDYATGSNTIPTAVASGTTAGTAVYNGQADPADITQAGGLSPYGTMGQNGNVWEWSESAFDGSNNVNTEGRAVRGGGWPTAEGYLRSSGRGSSDPAFESSLIGFRVASVPEPSAAMLVLLAAGAFWAAGRRRKSV